MSGLDKREVEIEAGAVAELEEGEPKVEVEPKPRADIFCVDESPLVIPPVVTLFDLRDFKLTAFIPDLPPTARFCDVSYEPWKSAFAKDDACSEEEEEPSIPKEDAEEADADADAEEDDKEDEDQVAELG